MVGFWRNKIYVWYRTSHKYFRKWIGLAYPAEPSVLYRSRENFGLQFRNFRQLTTELHVIKNHILKYSKDGEIRKLYNFLLKTDKSSRNISGSLRKFIPEKSRKRQLPATLELEQAERYLKFELALVLCIIIPAIKILLFHTLLNNSVNVLLTW